MKDNEKGGLPQPREEWNATREEVEVRRRATRSRRRLLGSLGGSLTLVSLFVLVSLFFTGSAVAGFSATGDLRITVDRLEAERAVIYPSSPSPSSTSNPGISGCEAGGSLPKLRMKLEGAEVEGMTLVKGVRAPNSGDLVALEIGVESADLGKTSMTLTSFRADLFTMNSSVTFGEMGVDHTDLVSALNEGGYSVKGTELVVKNLTADVDFFGSRGYSLSGDRFNLGGFDVTRESVPRC
ncbi:MAG: hypothetical protein SV760_07990 [Halobacteria archaeon]|nr:hypothetical protein [Halobacteria archaeon]